MDRETGAMLHKLADDCFIHALAALSPQSLEQPPCGAPSGAPSPQHLCQLADTLTTRARCILSLCQLQDLPYGQVFEADSETLTHTQLLCDDVPALLSSCHGAQIAKQMHAPARLPGAFPTT